MLGVEPAVLYRNLQIVDTVLAHGVRVPGDTELLRCRTYDLNTCLQFYRDWLRDAEYLQDPEWFTNRADHKALVLNIAINLPHCPRAFGRVFGAEDGAVWPDFLARYEAITGRSFRAVDETDFVPLWALEGLEADQVRAPRLADYHRYRAAQLEGHLATYTGRHPLPPGQAMAWHPETLVDGWRACSTLMRTSQTLVVWLRRRHWWLFGQF
jgi:hypothetical protein